MSRIVSRTNRAQVAVCFYARCDVRDLERLGTTDTRVITIPKEFLATAGTLAA